MEPDELYNQPKPEAHRVDDNKNPGESNLKRALNFGAHTEPVKEGKAMGGHKFGQEVHPPTGDDKNNPSQNAGYTNAYLAKTEPSEEYTDYNNFKAPGQEGEPNYQQSLPIDPAEHLNSHHDHAGPGDNAE
ncbi:hypothetical protein BEL04_15895 [Mucilaginibacter sp. PPCGB 2223]|uniref:hypothetical protein n=1 Tax=Mucilaginibacter sp. PPCGB 2223 TaxID=1886027 RepID=UPI000825DE26|nr:hypothetical protein [Mucilaginibacter sp. PPCGB 2223]OCX51506.1 hypothetical protein BEL04_15895 [Mucilaginibacter sp. PPCGB 2223]